MDLNSHKPPQTRASLLLSTLQTGCDFEYLVGAVLQLAQLPHCGLKLLPKHSMASPIQAPLELRVAWGIKCGYAQQRTRGRGWV